MSTLTRATAVAVDTALTISTSLVCSLLIRRHLQDFSSQKKQLLILYIICIAPVYSFGSVLCLAVPKVAIYVAFLIDCYQGFTLYSFMRLLFNYLGCEEDDFQLVTYLETKKTFYITFPLTIVCLSDIPKGKAFMNYFQSAIGLYCVAKPLSTAMTFILDYVGVYHEFSLSSSAGYLYVTVLLNLALFYTFGALLVFYHVFGIKLKPFQSVRKLLWVLFVLFFTHWQSVVLTGLVQAGVVSDFGEKSTPLVPTRIQDFIICIEMLLAIIFCWNVFSYEPYTASYVNPYDYADYDDGADLYSRSGRPGAVGADYRYSMINTAGDEEEGSAGGSRRSKSNRAGSSYARVPSGRSQLIVTDPKGVLGDVDPALLSSVSGTTNSSSSGGGGSVKGAPPPAQKKRFLRGPSILKRLQGKGQVVAQPFESSTLPVTSAVVAPVAASASSTRNPVVVKGPSFVIEGEDDEDDAVPPESTPQVEYLPADVRLLPGARSVSTEKRDLDDFGKDNSAVGGTTILRSIQDKYVDVDYDVSVDRSSLGGDTRNFSLDSLGVVNPLVEAAGVCAEDEEEEEEAIRNWAGKSMKERSASMEQRLADGTASVGSGGSGSAHSGGPRVVKKIITTTTTTRKKHHKAHAEQGQVETSERTHEDLKS